jgi:hypothetical protein
MLTITPLLAQLATLLFVDAIFLFLVNVTASSAIVLIFSHVLGCFNQGG